MDKLTELRQDIDQIDKEIVSLLEKRMDVVRAIAQYKIENQIATLDSNREADVLEKIGQAVQNSDYRTTILASYSDIMKQSRHYQDKHKKKA